MKGKSEIDLSIVNDSNIQIMIEAKKLTIKIFSETTVLIVKLCIKPFYIILGLERKITFL